MTLLSGRRARVLAGVIAASAGLIAACSTATGSDTSGGSAATGGAPAATSAGSTSSEAAQSGTGSGATQAGAPPCATAALSASIPAARDAASGHYGYPVNLTNHSSSSCTLNGYPGVSFVSGPGGSQIGAAAARATTAYIFVARPPQAVTVAPGQTVHADLQLITVGVFTSASCGPQNVNWVRIYPPNQTAPLYASLSAQTCSKGQDMLTVSPVQPAGAANP